MGSEPVHSPILLGCSILQYIKADVEQSTGEGGGGESGSGGKALSHAHRMGNMALQLGVFNVLLDLLDTEPFSGTSVSFICLLYAGQDVYKLYVYCMQGVYRLYFGYP